jgi:hypothetical protein
MTGTTTMVALRKLTAVPHLEQVGNVTSVEPIRIDRRAFSSLATREEAEYLFQLDHSRGGHVDNEWTAFFVESMVEFLIWQREPWGLIREDDLDWLVGLTADAPSPSLSALLFALVRELNSAPERLMTLALRHAKGRVL